MHDFVTRLLRLGYAWLYAEDCRAYWRPMTPADAPGFFCGRTRYHFGAHRL